MKDGTGITIGIDNVGSDYFMIRNNDIVGDGSPGSRGLACGSPVAGTRDNMISGFATGIFICANNGGNDIVP